MRETCDRGVREPVGGRVGSVKSLWEGWALWEPCGEAYERRIGDLREVCGKEAVWVCEESLGGLWGDICGRGGLVCERVCTCVLWRGLCETRRGSAEGRFCRGIL